MQAQYTPQIRLYQNWLTEKHKLHFKNYDAFWQWSVDNLDDFWRSIWDYFSVQSPTPIGQIFSADPMPHTRWFTGTQVNYAQQVLRHVKPASAAGLVAIVADNERDEVQELSWPELQLQIAAVALALRRAGVQRGDRVVAYMPNVPQTIIACLGVVSIGAVWSVCAPDMGTAAVLDRFKQIEPKVLIAVDGIFYGGKAQDRSTVVNELREALPSLTHTVVLESGLSNPAFTASTGLKGHLQTWSQFLRLTEFDVPAWRSQLDAFTPESLPFEHPLWVVYSSGTTGLPKPIVHGHGGIIMALLALKGLHNDIGCSYHENSFGERFHWYSSTGWVMWNAQMAGLATGTTICIYDGNPGGTKEQPDWARLWRFAAKHRVTFFGAGAAYYGNCMKAGLDLAAVQGAGHDISRIRALGSTGSPLPEDVQRWGSAQFAALRQVALQQGKTIPNHDLWWCNISGGTDFCGAFIGGHRELPQVPGRMQCRLLGCAVEAWSEAGETVLNEVGELVCTKAIPSMPLYFWGDENKARYMSSYFDMYPGVWRHGDWLRIYPDGSCVIYGRSDATINRHGLRMGTSEIYAAVEALPEVLDAMVVDLEYLGRESDMPLFVVLQHGGVLDAVVKERINAAIRTALSPRFVPNSIHAVPEIPRTLSGKKQELPVKKLLLGQPVEKVVNKDAMANPQSMDWFVQFARTRAATQAAA